ncbi:MAG: Glucose / Sorbosone dehydrogenase [candidate division BRC1 bacterium ADurb.BinA364]|nr:MAG: Glucose / Sorbosone dehydrogenase [candidate division BRC1 bacterium ADurb.BinA364]
MRQNGDVYAALRSRVEGKGLVALRDADGDGKAERVEYFGDTPGTGLALYKQYLYFGADDAVYRFPFREDDLLPGPAESIASGFPEQRSHAPKTIAIDPESGTLFVNVGAPSNACMEQTRTPGSPGMRPCPQLERQAGIWRFDADTPGQTQLGDSTRYATGIRNAVALDWNPANKRLYVAIHGRDQLSALFPQHYSEADSAELPAEELHMLVEGSNCGWPYTYYNHLLGKRMLAPEYGGDGKTEEASAEYQAPLLGFPGHWAPNDLVFCDSEQFPERYRGGAFIVFHGSWNRAPLEQAGFNVVFVPFDNGLPAGGWEVFADGFPGVDTVLNPRDARHRPTGAAFAPDGSLFVSDDVQGRIWRIRYGGE